MTLTDLAAYAGGSAMSNIIDRTTKHPKPKLYERQRDWSDIWGVTLHQTGCKLSNRHGRWDTLNAHIGVLSDGTVILCNALTDMIWHAQGLSHKTIGIEINGNHEGILGNRSTLWTKGGGPHTLTDQQVAACHDVLFPWLVEQFEAAGVPWSNVHAHRQSSSTRRSDPGSEIWQRVAMPWLVKLTDLGMGERGDGGPLFKVGSGRPIPHDWNLNYPGRY